MEQNWSARLAAGRRGRIVRDHPAAHRLCQHHPPQFLPQHPAAGGSGGAFRRCIPPALAQRDKLKDGADLSPYLAAIARNCMKNYFRTQGKQPPVRQSYEDLLLSDKSDLCGDAETTEAIRLPHPGAGQAGRAGPLSGDTLLLLWRKDLSIGKSLRSDRHCCPAQTPPKQRKTPEIYDRKGF